MFQVQAIDLDLGDNGQISYSILPPYDNLFIINNQGQVFNSENLNDSYYPLKIMAMDHGKPIRLNSTYDCHLSNSINDNLGNSNKSISLMNDITKFKYYYSYIFIILLILIFLTMMIGITICFYKFIYNHQRYYKENKTYHLYVSIPRKSLYVENESPCSSNESEEHERLVYLNDKV